MKWILPCALALFSVAAEAQAAKAKNTAEKFEVSSVVAEPVAKLGVHMAVVGIQPPELLVFSESEIARIHVRKGFALLHASWDFEAYRHFCSALKHDENCLMAYCGIVLSMSSPVHEFSEERARAFNRMLSLAEHKNGEEFVYPENERLYAVAIAELMVNGVGKGARVFSHIAKTYPNDLQAQLLTAHLTRGGYNSLGNPRVSQRMALDAVRKLAEQNPDSQMVLNFLILLEAEAPQQAVDFKGELLPLTQKLVAMSDGSVASWQALLGHVAWRAGQLDVAEQAFTKSSELYRSWKEMNQIGYADCEGLIRAELYLAAVLHEQGKIAEARQLVANVNNYQVAKGREASIGGVTLRWAASLMQAKLYMEQGEYEKARKALPTLPKREKMDAYAAVVTAYQLYLDAHIYSVKGNTSAANKQFRKLSELLSLLKKMQNDASTTVDFSEFLRSLHTLSILHKELKATLADSPAGAYTWYSSAIESQRTSSRLLPPDILFPMEFRLGQHFEKLGQKSKAREAYKAALKKRPSYQKAAKKLK